MSFNVPRLVLFSVLAVLSLSVSAADTPAVRRAREQFRWFKPEAARLALADLKQNPKYDYAKWSKAVEDVIAHQKDIGQWLDSNDPAENAKAVPYMKAYRDAMLANPALDCDRIVCTRYDFKDARTRFGDNQVVGFMSLNAHNHMWVPRNERAVDARIGLITNLRSDEPKFETVYRPTNGTAVRDLTLDWDAKHLLFSGIRFSGAFGVFEIPTALRNGSEKDRVEVSPARDKDIYWWNGVYCPDGENLIMLGTAQYAYLPCENGNEPMAVLYRVNRKTGKIRQLTFEQDSDYTPSFTHDGRVLFTRWEYSDTPHYFSRNLMTMNPDGIGQLALWGSGSYFPTFFYDARVVPGEPHLISMFAGGHHDNPEVGRLLLVDPTLARAYPLVYDPPDRAWAPAGFGIFRIPAKTLPKEKTGLVQEIPGYGKDVAGDIADELTANQFARGKPYFAHPFPLSKNYYLATCRRAPDGLFGVYLVDRFDNVTLIAETESGAYLEPKLLDPAERPPVIPDRVDTNKTTCTVHIADIYEGPGLLGVPRGTVKKLRLFSYHYTFHNTGGHESVVLDGVEGPWDIKRVLGTVDVEPDGSAAFEMPANVPISFQPLDKDGAALQLMRSWVVGMPGERVSCLGCHEDNRSSVVTSRTQADKKGAIQKIAAPADPVHPFGFANDVWPICQKYCLGSHGDAGRAPLRGPDQGGAEGKGLRLAMTDAQSAYRMIHPYVRRPGPESELPVAYPYEWHASTSPLVQMLRKGHHGVTVSAEDLETLYAWIDLNAPWRSRWGSDQEKRRTELNVEFANVADNPEAEDRARCELLAKRGAPARVEPKTAARPAERNDVNDPRAYDERWAFGLQQGDLGLP